MTSQASQTENHSPTIGNYIAPRILQMSQMTADYLPSSASSAQSAGKFILILDSLIFRTNLKNISMVFRANLENIFTRH
jgi:hypothetical protein